MVEKMYFDTDLQLEEVLTSGSGESESIYEMTYSLDYRGGRRYKFTMADSIPCSSYEELRSFIEREVDKAFQYYATAASDIVVYCSTYDDEPDKSVVKSFNTGYRWLKYWYDLADEGSALARRIKGGKTYYCVKRLYGNKLYTAFWEAD